MYFLTEALFDRRIAFIAAGVLALLPRVAEVGHETLADSLGLFATFIGPLAGGSGADRRRLAICRRLGRLLRARLPGPARGHPRSGRHRLDLARRSLETRTATAAGCSRGDCR